MFISGGGAWASSWVGAKGEGAQDKGKLNFLCCLRITFG